jgi:short-subunit dehydrogenase
MGEAVPGRSHVEPKDLAILGRFLREDSRVNLLVNNAGAGATAPLLNSNVDEMSRADCA